MGDEERERPSLEPPKLFGRKKAKDAAPAPAAPVEQPEVVAEVVTEVESQVVEPAADTAAFEDAGSTATTGDTAVLEATAAAIAVEEKPAKPAKAPKPAKEPKTPKEPREGPLLPGRPASALIGLVVGGVLIGLTLAGMEGCEAVRGTSSCGTAPGMISLIVIFAICVAVGAFLLKAVQVPDPGATSFLAVGLTCVVALVFVDLLDSWPVVAAIPLLTALTFLMSWWVTTTYVEGSN